MSIFKPFFVERFVVVLVLIATGTTAVAQSPTIARSFFEEAHGSATHRELRLAPRTRVVSAAQEESADSLEVVDPMAQSHEILALADVDLGAAFDRVLSSAPAERRSQSGMPGRYGGASETLDYLWAPRNLVRRPLYFQDVLLERHGFTYGPVLQPIESGLRFVGDYLIFPFRAVKQPCHERQSVLGLDRPGS